MRLHVWMCASAVALAPALFAQTRLTLADAVSEAVKVNPQLATAEARIGVAEGLRQQAGLGPNPRLTLQSENTRAWGSPPFSYGRDADTLALLTHTFETGGKRTRRVELGTANVRRSEIERELQRRQIISRVSAAYWLAAGAARSRDLLLQEAAGFERVVQFHRDRVREGAAPEVDLLRIELERDRLLTAARTAGQDAERARIALFREMGKTEFPAIEFVDALEQASPIETIPLDQVLLQRPEMQLARQSIEQAEANLRLQQANARTDPDVQVGYKRTAGLSLTGPEAFNTIYGSIQIPLAIRNRNQGQIAAAVADIRATQSSLAAAAALVRAEVESATLDYQSRQRLLAETLRPMRDRADEVYRIADAAYREGGSDILRLLDAERTRIETQLAYVRTLAELQQSAVAVATAQGNLK